MATASSAPVNCAELSRADIAILLVDDVVDLDQGVERLVLGHAHCRHGLPRTTGKGIELIAEAHRHAITDFLRQAAGIGGLHHHVADAPAEIRQWCW